MSVRHRAGYLALAASALVAPLISAGPATGAVRAAGPQFRLQAVSCPRSDLCLAVGERFTAKLPQISFGELWNGKRWRVVPTPSISGGHDNALNSVTCLSARHCLAVGEAFNRAGTEAIGLVAAWNGARWRRLHLAIPAGAALDGVSCAAGACLIVGDRNAGRDRVRPLALLLRGTKVRVLKPLQPTEATEAVLAGVSCAGPSSCVAAGTSLPGPGGNSDTVLVETWNGTRWRIAKVPHPKALTQLQSVSCANSANCLAVGWAVAGSGLPRTVTLLDKNGRWRLLTPVPASKRPDSPLDAVSCTTASRCVAAGASGVDGARVWNGTTLRNVSTQTARDGSLFGISCVSATRCVTVGSEVSGANNLLRPLAELWNGARWKVLPIG